MCVVKNSYVNNTKLPVCYRNQKNMWVTRNVFLNWFNSEFDPSIHHYLSLIRFPIEAILLLDTAQVTCLLKNFVVKISKCFDVFPTKYQLLLFNQWIRILSKTLNTEKITFEHCCR
uniref:Tigger transposable element-derived protein 7 n=1 Tax=Schizaphis graminum TaxID=13262 RepID=A0A2S2PU99_SCHGA